MDVEVEVDADAQMGWDGREGNARMRGWQEPDRELSSNKNGLCGTEPGLRRKCGVNECPDHGCG